jgi:hypothetical protein
MTKPWCCQSGADITAPGTSRNNLKSSSVPGDVDGDSGGEESSQDGKENPTENRREG